ncbi:MAG: excinuclease ABC subunit UvrC [Candidatus Margulisiibacteriota bacterium]
MKLNSVNKQYIIQEAKLFPNNPGIYKMYDAGNILLYIGKAKNLKKRIINYFNNQNNLDLKTQFLVQQIKRLEFIITNNEKEAFILENQLIKDFKPKYNILLKDDKNYPLIKITHEIFPRIEIVRQVLNDNAQYFGPLPLMGNLKRLLSLFQSLFKLRNCKQEIDLVKMQKKCLLVDLNKCLGPCINKNIKIEYDQVVKDLTLLLTGKSQELLKKLKQKMLTFSQKLEFENAAEIKERIAKIEKIIERQSVNLLSKQNIHAWASAENEGFYYILVQNIVEGKLINQQGFYLENRQNFHEFFVETFLTYYSKNQLPNKIFLEKSFAKIEDLLTFFKGQDKKATLIFPKTGINKQVLDLAKKNAQVALERIEKQQNFFDLNILTELKKICLLTNMPNNIIAFDISHMAGENIVGTAVFFKNGIPEKSLYRKYHIKSLTQKKSNDPQCIFEIVLRRLKDIEKNENFFLLIDGGLAQLNFAIKAIEKLKLKNIELISLAKKEELIYLGTTKKTLSLNKNDKGLLFLQRIRDEAHRFSISFQRKQQEGFLKNIKLAKIEGLGKKRINLLYSKFKTIDTIKDSSIEEIAAIGISKKLASAIKDFLNK